MLKIETWRAKLHQRDGNFLGADRDAQATGTAASRVRREGKMRRYHVLVGASGTSAVGQQPGDAMLCITPVRIRAWTVEL